jgi:hypothetical protein
MRRLEILLVQVRKRSGKLYEHAISKSNTAHRLNGALD